MAPPRSGDCDDMSEGSSTECDAGVGPPPEAFVEVVERAAAPPGGRLLRVALYDDVGGSSVLRGEPERRGAALLEQCLAEGPIGGCGFATRRVRAGDIAAGALAEFDVLAMPGGRGWHQGAALGEEGRQRLRDWLRGGGGYLGICGGANAASSDPWYLPGNALELLPLRNADSGPGLPGKANHRGFGPVRLKVSEHGRRILGHESDSAMCYYHNGPVLRRAAGPQESCGEQIEHDEESGLMVLAWYGDDIARTRYARDIRFGKVAGVRMRDQAAACAAPFGKGRVVVFGPHPERRSIHGLRKSAPQQEQQQQEGAAASPSPAAGAGPTHWVRSAAAWAAGADRP